MLEGFSKWIAGLVAVTVAPFAQVGEATAPPPTEMTPPPATTIPMPTPEGSNPFAPQAGIPTPPAGGDANYLPPLQGSQPGMQQGNGNYNGGMIPPSEGMRDTDPRYNNQQYQDQYKERYERQGGMMKGDSRSIGQYHGGNPPQGGLQGFPDGDQRQDMMNGRQGGNRGGMSFTGDASWVKRLEKLLVQVKAKGTPVPAEAEAALTAFKAAVDAAKNSSGEDNDNLRSAVDDAREGVMELEPQLRMLQQWANMVKQANRPISMLKKQLAKARTRATAKKVDVSKFVSRVEEIVTGMEKQLADAKNSVSAGQVEDAFELLREVQPDPDEQEEMQYNMRMIEMAAQLSKMPAEINRHIKVLENKVNALAKRKNPETDERYDVTELRDLIKQMKQIAINVKAKVEAGEDPDTVMETADEGMGLYEEFMSTMSELTGEEYGYGMPSGGDEMGGGPGRMGVRQGDGFQGSNMSGGPGDFGPKGGF